jgi:BolA protein
MSLHKQIETKIRRQISADHLEVINESHLHDGPPDAESHFRLIIVSDSFKGVSLVERHRTIHEILREELQEDLHALSLRTHTLDEWKTIQGSVPQPPPCLGGSKISLGE